MAASAVDPGNRTRTRPAVVIEPQGRNSITFNADLIRAAELQAEGGSLWLAAQCVEWLLGDDRLGSVLETRESALFGAELLFEAGTGRKKKQALKALELEDDFGDMFPNAELRQLVRWGILLGLGLGQMVPLDAKRGRDLWGLEFMSARWLRYDWQKERPWQYQTAGAARSPGGAYVDVVPGDGQWILHTPHGSKRPWMHGKWRALSRWVLLKQYAMSDFGTAGSNAAGAKSAEAVEGANEEDRQQLLADLTQLQGGGSIVAPKGYKLGIVALQASNEEIYQAQIDLANTGIAIAILGANLGTEVTPGAGSKAAATVHADVPLGRTRADERSLSATLHDQALAAPGGWAEANFGKPELAPWPTWDIEPDEDMNERATMLSTAADALTKLDALGVDIEPLAEDFGLEMLPEAERAPAPPPPGQQMPQQGPPGSQQQAPAPNVATPQQTPSTQEPEKARADVDGIRLRSGAPAASRRGFVQGQIYADAVADNARTEASADLRDDVDAALEAIANGASYDDIRRGLLTAYKRMDPGKVAETTKRAIVMTNMAGRASVQEDVKR